MSVIIIGAGQAGMQMAISLRDNGYDKAITLIGNESFYPYQRPPLSKTFLQNEITVEKLLLRKENFYNDRDIDVKLNCHVHHIDKVSKSVSYQQTNQNTPLSLNYDKLIFTTGAKPWCLPVDDANPPKNMHVMRTIQDAINLRNALAQQPKNIVVIGGGFIGLEVAASMKKTGHKITLLSKGRFMERAVCETVSDFYHQLHHKNGADIHYIDNITKIDATHIHADGVNYPADLILMGVGALPDIDLAKQIGLTISHNAILTDKNGQCDNEPDIFAIGDCAASPNQWASEQITRLESIQNATDSAKNTAHYITTNMPQAHNLPWFWSDQYDCKLQIAGLMHDSDQKIIRGNPDSNQFSIFYLKDKRIISVTSINQGKHHIIARKIIPLQQIIDNPEILSDETIDLKNIIA